METTSEIIGYRYCDICGTNLYIIEMCTKRFDLVYFICRCKKVRYGWNYSFVRISPSDEFDNNFAKDGEFIGAMFDLVDETAGILNKDYEPWKLEQELDYHKRNSYYNEDTSVSNNSEELNPSSFILSIIDK